MRSLTFAHLSMFIDLDSFIIDSYFQHNSDLIAFIAREKIYSKPIRNVLLVKDNENKFESCRLTFGIEDANIGSYHETH